MGKREAIEAYNANKRERSADAARKWFEVQRRAVKQNNQLRSRLHDILAEEDTYTDRNGVSYTVNGSKTQDNPVPGAQGIDDIFADPKFLKKPFQEASRCMPDLFKMYCLVNGISDDNMMAIGAGGVKPETMDQVRKLRKNFFEMVLDGNVNQISDFYFGIANYLEKKMPDLVKCTGPEGLADNCKNLILTDGTISYLGQTFSMNVPDQRSPQQERMINAINERLDDGGKDYTLKDMSNAMFFAQNAFNSISRGYIDRFDTGFTANDLIDSNYCMKSNEAGTTAKMMQSVALLTQESREMQKHFSPGHPFVNIGQEEFHYTHAGLSHAEIMGPEVGNWTVSVNTADLAARMEGNVRKNIFKQDKKNSPEYDRVLNQLQKINAKSHDFMTDEERHELYNDLYKFSNEYLQKKNPHGKTSEARYAMILEAREAASQGLEKFGTISKTDEWENVSSDEFNDFHFPSRRALYEQEMRDNFLAMREDAFLVEESQPQVQENKKAVDAPGKESVIRISAAALAEEPEKAPHKADNNIVKKSKFSKMLEGSGEKKHPNTAEMHRNQGMGK